MNKILVGCDPELFVRKNGKFISAHGLVKGDKKNPFSVEKGAVQVDGMALEFNIVPASSSHEFYTNISCVMDILQGMVPDCEMVCDPVAHFDMEVLNAQPAEALELGCDPDFNGWTLGENIKPNANVPFRTASGHVHVGWTEGENSRDSNHFSVSAAVARQLDFFLGLPSLIFDSQTQRRELYGKAGCFRPKSYGMEYRVLSNKWLASKELMAWVFDNTVKGMAEFFKGNELCNKYGDVQEILNLSKKEEALKILKNEGIVLPC